MPENDFEMIPITGSSQIEAVGFNPVTKQGRVAFIAKGHSPGSLYEYDGCTDEEFRQIVTAPSVGTAFGSIWKGQKPYRKIA